MQAVYMYKYHMLENTGHVDMLNSSILNQTTGKLVSIV